MEYVWLLGGLLGGLAIAALYFWFIKPSSTMFGAPAHEFKNSETWGVDRDADGFISSISVNRNVKEF